MMQETLISSVLIFEVQLIYLLDKHEYTLK